MSELLPRDLVEAEAIEMAFRRGVHHGAQMACRAASAGTPLPLLFEWINTVLCRWRSCEPRHSSVKPPAPPTYTSRRTGRVA